MNQFKAFLWFFIFSFFLLPPFSQAALRNKTLIPDFGEITHWLEAPSAITRKGLEGNIVLICFWNATDSRSFQAIKILRRWHEIYSPSAPFLILGIAVPEFTFQKEVTSEEILIHKYKIPFPVGLDSRSTLSNAYQIRSWPTLIMVDHEGQIRNTYSGMIDYHAVELDLQKLLADTPSENPIPFIETSKIPTLENYSPLYFGYKKLFGFGNIEKIQAEHSQFFTAPEQNLPFHFYLSNHWKFKEESLAPEGLNSLIKIPFQATTVGLVAGSLKKSTVPVEIRLDGKPVPKNLKGKEVVLQEGRSYVFIKDYQLYRLVRFKKKPGPQMLELIFEGPGTEIFKMSFE